MAISASVIDWLTEVRYRTDDGIDCLTPRPPCATPVQVRVQTPPILFLIVDSRQIVMCVLCAIAGAGYGAGPGRAG